MDRFKTVACVIGVVVIVMGILVGFQLVALTPVVEGLCLGLVGVGLCLS